MKLITKEEYLKALETIDKYNEQEGEYKASSIIDDDIVCCGNCNLPIDELKIIKKSEFVDKTKNTNNTSKNRYISHKTTTKNSNFNY